MCTPFCVPSWLFSTFSYRARGSRKNYFDAYVPKGINEGNVTTIETLASDKNVFLKNSLSFQAIRKITKTSIEKSFSDFLLKTSQLFHVYINVCEMFFISSQEIFFYIQIPLNTHAKAHNMKNLSAPAKVSFFFASTGGLFYVIFFFSLQRKSMFTRCIYSELLMHVHQAMLMVKEKSRKTTEKKIRETEAYWQCRHNRDKKLLFM